MPVPYMALTRDWMSATVNHPDRAVMGHKPLLTVSGCRRGWRGCVLRGGSS